MWTRRGALAAGAATAALGAGAAGAKPAKATDPLAEMDATETARRIRAGEITAAEAVRAAVGRAERRNPEINAVVNQRYYDAQAVAETSPKGLFGGVPTYRKDLNDLEGLPTEHGSRAYKGAPAVAVRNPYPFFERFDGMGFVYLGKSATPEFGLTATTEPLSHGPTRNPWNLGHSTGGSSGGAAALVAAGVVPVAHASDGGGSIRIPASCCGVFGLKASRGRYPAPYDVTGLPIVLSIHGLISRSVRDTAAFVAGMEQPSDMPGVGLVEGRARSASGSASTPPRRRARRSTPKSSMRRGGRPNSAPRSAIQWRKSRRHSTRRPRTTSCSTGPRAPPRRSEPGRRSPNVRRAMPSSSR